MTSPRRRPARARPSRPRAPRPRALPRSHVQPLTSDGGRSTTRALPRPSPSRRSGRTGASAPIDAPVPRLLGVGGLGDLEDSHLGLPDETLFHDAAPQAAEAIEERF